MESQVELALKTFVENDGSVSLGGERRHGDGSGFDGMERKA